MGKFFFDIDKEDVAYKASDRVAVKANGDMLVRLSDHVAMDVDTGEMHLISGWSKDNEKDNTKKRR